MRVPKYIAMLVSCLFPFLAQAQPSTVQCPVPPPGLVNWWTFDEESGPSFDRAATRNNGARNGATSTAQRPESASGLALCFQKAGDFVSVPHHDEVDLGAEDFTIAFWLRSESASGVQTIADKRVTLNGKVRGYALFLHKGRPGIQIANNGYDNYIAPITINDGAWHFVAFAVRRTAGGGAIFVDESNVLTFTPRSGTLQNNTPLVIGQASPGFAFGDTRFRGCIDELQVYRFVALDQEAISALKTLYRLPCKSVHPKASTDLTAWWRFDEPWGAAARDSVGSPTHNISRVNASTCAGISGTGLRPSPMGSVGGSDAAITFGTNDFSILLWVRTENAALNGGRRVLLDKGGTGKSGWQLIVMNGKLGVSLNGTDHFAPEAIQPNLNDEKWHLVGAWVSPTTAAAALWVYSDSGPAFESSFPIDGMTNLTSTASLRVGGSIVANSAFRGCYDELQIGPFLMDASDVQAIHKARTHGEAK